MGVNQYLVTGGAGFIGSHLVDALVAQRHKVTVLDNLSSGKLQNLNAAKTCKFLRHDIRDTDFIFNNLANKYRFDGIFHLAAMARIQPSFDSPCETLAINSQGTANMLELSRLHNARFVYSGSSTFYFDVRANPYAYAKWLGEEHCKLYSQLYGLPVSMARFFNVFGPRHLEEGPYSTVIGIFEKQSREGKPLTVTGTGKQRRDFSHVADIVRGLLAIDEYLQVEPTPELEVFALGTGENYSINEIADMFECDKVYLPQRPGEADVTLADIERSKRILNWEPQNNIKDYVQYIKNLRNA